MKINGSPAYVNAIKVFIDQQQRFKEKAKPNRQFVKEDPPELQQMRELIKNNKKAMERYESDQIAKKIARGESITEVEREKLRATDPEKLRKAEEANFKRASVSKKLARAKTKAEASAIIANEKSMAVSIFEKGDQALGELYLEAIDKAENDYYQEKKSKPARLENPVLPYQQQTFDIRR